METESNLPPQIIEIEQILASIDPERLDHRDFGTKHFRSEMGDLERILSMITVMTEGIKSNKVYQEDGRLMNEVLAHVRNLNGHFKNFDSYTIDQPDAKREKIRTNFYDWINSLFTGYKMVEGKAMPNNFLNIYAILKSSRENKLILDQLNEQTTDSKNVRKHIKEISEARDNANKILEELKNKAAEESVKDYAEIFRKQAEKHSSFDIGLKRNWRVGESQKWLLAALVSGVGLVFLINNLDLIFTWEENSANEFKIVQLISRLAVVSFGIYMVTFFFKQYSIHKHLFTLNKHRQNTLDSYELFISSLKEGDGDIRNALMMEVAKAIYESGNTGYLSSKNSESSPSIIEITRLMNKGKE